MIGSQLVVRRSLGAAGAGLRASVPGLRVSLGVSVTAVGVFVLTGTS